MEPLLQAPLLGHNARGRGVGASDAERAELQRRIELGVYLSLAANIALLLAKTVAFWFSGSMAVAASAVDSLIDLASQALIALADRAMSRKSPEFPAGRARLEPVSVLGCAYIMTIGALEVVRQSSTQLYAGFKRGELPRLDMTPPMYAILVAATAIKLALWVYCFALRAQSGALLALAEDHMNDVASNLGAVVTAAIASYNHERLWWVDPGGGIAISFYIIASWTTITWNQILKIVGRSAPTDFVAALTGVAAEHHFDCSVAYLRAFNAGQRYQVDIELLGPPGMSVAEASAVAKELKAKVESLPEVESAAVVVLHSHLPRSHSGPEVLPSALPKQQTFQGGGPAAVRTAVHRQHPSDAGCDIFAFDAGEAQADIEHGGDGWAAREGERSTGVVAPGMAITAPELPPGSLAGHLMWSRSLRGAPDASIRRASYASIAAPDAGDAVRAVHSRVQASTPP